MPSEGKPQGGIHLSAGFGVGPRADPAAAAADIAFVLTVVGDFHGAGDGGVVEVPASDFPAFLASFGAAVELDAPNRLGSAPPALAVRLPISSIQDLDPKTIAKRIPQIAAAERLVASARTARSASDIAGGPGLDHVAALLQGAATPLRRDPSPAPPPADDDDGSLDRLLSMVDAPTSAVGADAAQSAVSAFVSAFAKPQHASTPVDAAARLIADQARDVATHPDWRAAEAAWRSLHLILAARGGRSATRIELCDARRSAIADTLESAEFEEHVAGDGLRAIVVLGAYGRSDKDLEELDRLALAAERLARPVIVSLDKDVFGAAPDAVAAMDNPAALLAGRGYEAWRGLRSRDESRWLFAAWNDFVLRPEADAIPALWGEPGVIVAAQILRSLARTGWPTEILGGETALSGLDIAEAAARGGRTVAIPLRAMMDLGIARDLAQEGVISLVCRPDRDQVWLARASSVHAFGGSAASAEGKAMESLSGLSFRFVSAYFETLLSAIVGDLAGRGAVTAERIAAQLQDALSPTGAGASARVTEADADDGGRGFEISIRLGPSVMGGFGFSLDMAI